MPLDRPLPDDTREALKMLWSVNEDQQTDINRHRDSLHKIWHVAPVKPREGMLIFADGVDWDPGSGAGYYVYVGGAWVSMVAGGTPPAHTHDAADITTGVMAPARLGTGTPSSTTYLRGDGAWTDLTWTTTSDARTKRNVRELEGGLEVIGQLRPIEAEYNGLAGTPEGQRMVGFVAQELKEILPHAVTSHWGKLRADDSEQTEILSISTHEVIMQLVVAVKQLTKRVNELEAAIP